MSRIRKATLVGVVLLPVVASGFFLQAASARQGPGLLDQVLSIVQDRFVDTLPSGQLYEKAARGLVRELNDPYSELLAPKDLKQFTTRTGGHYGGVGMLIENQEGQITISKVYPHTPAQNAGVREGDRIIQIDSNVIRGWTLQQVSDYMQGAPKTKVTVRFVRPGMASPIVDEFTRAIIHVPAVPYAMMLGNNVGYILLDSFNETAFDEMRSAVKQLAGEGAHGIILDFRRNPGGILDQSLEISNLFLNNGEPIATVRGRNGDSSQYVAKGAPLLPTTPLVVLTDGYTASAAEIVTGALQDHDRALVVGQTSFGKGLVQSVFNNLDGGYALKLTTAKWYTPSGRSIQKERKYENGHFIEEPVDSAQTEAAKKKRPAYKSDAGRVVYGGGGITPDVLVADDTLSTAEQNLNKTFGLKFQEVWTVLSDYGLELSKQVRPDFHVEPAWRDELYRRLEAHKIDVDKKTYDAGTALVDRMLEQRVTFFAYGDTAVRRRELPYDAPLRKALEILQKSQTQKDLFAVASAMRTASAVRKP